MFEQIHSYLQSWGLLWDLISTFGPGLVLWALWRWITHGIQQGLN